MTSLQVSYFLRVAESMSFSKAAEELYVSQPSVSRQVQLLEAELGHRLFDRSSKRKLRLTPAGAVFRDFFQQSVKGYYWNYFMNVMLILFCGVVCYLPISRVREVTVLNWFLKEAICFVVVNGAFFMRYRKTSEMKDMLQKVLFLVRSKRA